MDLFDRFISQGAIKLADAGGYCGKFMTFNPHVGASVRRFARDIGAFFKSASSHRPLNCVVWAAPGSGKSFLVEEVAAELSAAFVEINVSTLATRAELQRQIAKARDKDAAKVVIMIDECWTQLEHSYIFGSLLGPTWAKTATKKVAFVMVDSLLEHSTEEANVKVEVGTVDDFLKAIGDKKSSKGPDLISRINGPTITLKQPSPIDRAVVVASLIRRVHERTAFAIEEVALRALVRGQMVDGREHWSPRAAEYVIEAITPSGGVVRYQDLTRVKYLCDRLHVELNEQHDSAKVEVAIIDPPKGN
jgi:Ni2+-binding GTPase involved in maturation of urease and hydrogenase